MKKKNKKDYLNKIVCIIYDLMFVFLKLLRKKKKKSSYTKIDRKI